MDRLILKNKTILIVDDYAVNTELLSLFVADAGAIPLTASNGLECIGIVKTRHVDMILMDSNMPVMNGLDTTRELRLLPEGKDLIIVGISGNDNADDERACLDAGMNCVVPKLTLNDTKLIKLAASLMHSPDTPAENELNPSSTQCTDSTDPKTHDQIMDYKKALREFENDTELLNSLIIEFNKISNNSAQSMKLALDRGDYATIQKESHGIKGGAANLCAMPLADAAKTLENACRANALQAEIEKLYGNLVTALTQFDSFVNKLLSKN